MADTANTKLVTIEEIKQTLSDRFNIADAAWYASLAKTAHSKNITTADWNAIVLKASSNTGSVEALKTALIDAINTLHAQAVALEDTAASHKTSIETLYRATNMNSSTLATYTRKTDSLVSSTSSISANLNTAKENLSKLSVRVSAINDEVTGLSTAYPSVKTIAEDAKTLGEDLRDVELPKKQNKLSFDGNYDSKANKVATVDTVVRKVAEIVAAAPEDFDTLKELADWLETHGTEAAEMNSAVEQHSAQLSQHESKLDEHSQQIVYLRGETNGLGGFVMNQFDVNAEVHDELRKHSVELSEHNGQIADNTLQLQQHLNQLDNIYFQMPVRMTLDLDPTSFILTASLWNESYTWPIITSNPIDLPLESAVVDIRVQKDPDMLILCTRNGTEIPVDMKDLFRDVVDSLDSNDSGKALAASVGPKIKELINSKLSNITFEGLPDKPFEGTASISLSMANNQGAKVALNSGRKAYFQTGKTYTVDELIGAKAQYQNDSNTLPYTIIEAMIVGSTADGVTIKVNDEYIIVAYTTNYIPTDKTTQLATTPLPYVGVYFTEDSSGDYYIHSLSKEATATKRLDGEFIKLYKHTVFINGIYDSYGESVAKIYVSFLSPSSKPITTLQELEKSPACANGYLQCSYPRHQYYPMSEGMRDVYSVTISNSRLNIEFITAYTVPATTMVHSFGPGISQYFNILDTVTEV